MNRPTTQAQRVVRTRAAAGEKASHARAAAAEKLREISEQLGNIVAAASKAAASASALADLMLNQET